FQADTAVQVILAHRDQDPRLLPELRADVPAGLWQGGMRLLAKDPARPYPTPPQAAEGPAPVWQVGPHPLGGPSAAPLSLPAGARHRPTPLPRAGLFPSGPPPLRPPRGGTDPMSQCARHGGSAGERWEWPGLLSR